jgi:hypothetical protein
MASSRVLMGSISDKEVQQQFFGHLEAKGGKIRSTS